MHKNLNSQRAVIRLYCIQATGYLNLENAWKRIQNVYPLSSHTGSQTSTDEHGGLQQPLLRGSCAGACQAEGGGEEERCSYPGAGGLHW